MWVDRCDAAGDGVRDVGVGDVDAVVTDGVTERLAEVPNANRTAAEAMTSTAIRPVRGKAGAEEIRSRADPVMRSKRA